LRRLWVRSKKNCKAHLENRWGRGTPP